MLLQQPPCDCGGFAGRKHATNDYRWNVPVLQRGEWSHVHAEEILNRVGHERLPFARAARAVGHILSRARGRARSPFLNFARCPLSFARRIPLLILRSYRVLSGRDGTTQVPSTTAF